MKETPPYTALAAIYDVVMEYVEYDFWAEYMLDLLAEHHPEAASILELGCGTGTFALELVRRYPCRYLATDAMPGMIRVAEAKAALEQASVQFSVADFTNFRLDSPVDVVLLLYDGLNYLLDPASVRALFRCVHRALKPGGLFIFDQSTPANSLNNEAYFEDQGRGEDFSYVRHSTYDRTARIHTTTFDITVEGTTFHETHRQRAYTLAEIRAFRDAAAFEEVAAFDGFSHDPATEASERIHWVWRRLEPGAAT